MSETRILLLRHAETTAPDLFHGSESDVGLGEKGVRQALAVAELLAAERPEAVVSSAMRRAVDTAEPIARACHLNVEVEPALHERRMGPLAGVSRENGLDVYRETIRRWKAGELDFAHEGGESFAQVRDRSVPAFTRVAERWQGKTAVVVAHGMVIRVILTTLLGDGPAEFDRFKIENVAINDLRWDGAAWSAKELNRTLGGDLDGFSW